VKFGRSWLKALWQGNRPLWEAFWVFGVGIPLVIKGVLLAFIRFSGAPAGAAITTLGTALVLDLVFALVSVWRCSPNTSRKTWSYMARGWVILVPLMAFYRIINS
jgi:hypothetical protein